VEEGDPPLGGCDGEPVVLRGEAGRRRRRGRPGRRRRGRPGRRREVRRQALDAPLIGVGDGGFARDRRFSQFFPLGAPYIGRVVLKIIF
jgi:hypothetical protein